MTRASAAPGVLARIIAHKREELAALRRRRLPPEPPRRPVELRRQVTGELSLLAEIKHRSPSAGALSTALSVGERARAYEAGGARLISVLCDETFFGGRYEHLSEARSSVSIPLLCKEFVIDEVQLDAARAFGADAVLLIVRCLPQPDLQRLLTAAHDRQLEALVEIHGPEEASRALDAGARLVGVNARDLDTLQMHPEQAREVLEALPAQVVRAHLSGVAGPADVRRVAASSADAALIGETLMRRDDPTPLLRELCAAAR